MANLEIKISAVEPFAEGRSFGDAGPYLRIRGVAKGELDPAAPENRVVADLDKAPRNAEVASNTKPISSSCGRPSRAGLTGCWPMT